MNYRANRLQRAGLLMRCSRECMKKEFGINELQMQEAKI